MNLPAETAQIARAQVYYNEIDPYCAAWLQNLMDAGHIPRGVIDTRSIEDVRPDELAGFTQCHFFAGLGGWAYALQLAGWGTRPVWTGSCPCQPFSAAGKGAGFADERHLWPSWQHLIAQCRPAVVFGEQVASKDADAWIDLVHADLEGMGYAFGCVPFPAAGIGAPHIRDRNYWVADAYDTRLEGRQGTDERSGQRAAGPHGLASRVADADGRKRDGIAVVRGHERNWANAGRAQGIGSAAARGDICRLAHATPSGRREEHADGRGGAFGDSAQGHATGPVHGGSDSRRGPTNGFWRDADWIGCTDGKWRPVESGAQPLAHGIPGRVGRLRAYGNAIVPQAAQAFIESYCEARGLMPLEVAA